MRIRCVVAGESYNGPGLWFVVVEVMNESDLDEGEHYDAARRWARFSYDVDPLMVVFDEYDGPAGLFRLFEWSTATVVDKQGEPIQEVA